MEFVLVVTVWKRLSRESVELMRNFNDILLITAGYVPAGAILSFYFMREANILPSLESYIQGLGVYGRFKKKEDIAFKKCTRLASCNVVFKLDGNLVFGFAN